MFKYILMCLFSLLCQIQCVSGGLQAQNIDKNFSKDENWGNKLQNLLHMHGFLLNQVIVGEYNDLPSEVESRKQQLMSNSRELGKVFSSLFGSGAGKQFVALFNEHIKLGGDYIKADKLKQPTGQIAQQALQNGRQIADLFSQWFPSIPSGQWQKMLEDHVNIEAKQADAYFKNDINQARQLKDESLKQLMQLGDLLIKGINNDINK